jgi:hypothetical protein
MTLNTNHEHGDRSSQPPRQKVDTVQALRDCLQEFADNHKCLNGTWYSPLDEQILAELYNSELQEKNLFKEQMVQLQTALNKQCGVTQEIYDDKELGYTLRTLVRDATDSRWWGSNYIQLCEPDDREGSLANDSIRERFRDGDYRNVNVFEILRDSQGDQADCKEEGTLFHLKFSPDGTATSIQIFHQGHRDRLIVKTISWDDLRKFIDDELHSAPPTRPPEFPLSSAEYSENIKAFNDRFNSEQIALSFLEEENDSKKLLAITILNKNPRNLASELVELKLARTWRDGTQCPSVECKVLNTDDKSDEYWLDLIPVRSNPGDNLKITECSPEDAASTAIIFSPDSANKIETVLGYMEKRSRL